MGAQCVEIGIRGRSRDQDLAKQVLEKKSDAGQCRTVVLVPIDQRVRKGTKVRFNLNQVLAQFPCHLACCARGLRAKRSIREGDVKAVHKDQVGYSIRVLEKGIERIYSTTEKASGARGGLSTFTLCVNIYWYVLKSRTPIPGAPQVKHVLKHW